MSFTFSTSTVPNLEQINLLYDTSSSFYCTQSIYPQPSGREGLSHWLELVREELVAQMILSGVDRVSAIDAETLAR